MTVKGKKVIAVLPAYNAEKTIELTVAAIPEGAVDDTHVEMKGV